MNSKPMDFWGDKNQQQLYAIEHLYGVPEFVKRSTAESTQELREVSTESFGDPVRRLFPCHTKAATWLANAYFQVAKHAYSKEEHAVIQERIEKNASFWGIKSLLGKFNQVFNKLANADTGNLPDQDYALVVKTGNETIRRMPIANPISVKMAGEYLFANRFRYPYMWRKTAARRIIARALHYDELAEKGVKLAGAAIGATRFEPQTSEYLERAAGFGTTHPARAAEKVAQRVLMLGKDHPMIEKLATIALELNKQRKATLPQLSKLAQVIDAVDRDTGICDHYGEGVELPEDMFFDVLQKEAESILDEHVTLTTGNSFPIGVFGTLPLEKVGEVLGTDFSQAITRDGVSVDPVKFAEVAHTLPRGDAQLLERMLEDSLKLPHSKEARAPRMSKETFTKEDLTARLTKEGKKVETVDFDIQYKANHAQAAK